MLDRTIAPPFNRSISFDLIKPEIQSLPNGLNVYFVAGGEQAVIRIDFVINAGRWFEKPWGVSHFTANLLNKGTKLKSSFDIAKIFDQYGAHLEITPGLDYVAVSLYALTKSLKPVLDLLLEIFMQPTFSETELEQSKSIYLQNLKVNNEKTSFQASKFIRRNIFGDQHPYGKELDSVDVTPINRDHLSTFFQNYFSDFQVIVSGQITDETRQLITDALSGCRYKTVVQNPSIIEGAGERQQYVKKDGSVQTSIRMGRKSLLRSHADYVDVLFLNHILGGFFGSRLMKNIREEKGLTYGIYSSLHAMKYDSFTVIGADVNAENRELTFEELRKELKRLRTDKIDLEELNTARYHFIGSLQAEITTPFAHAEKIRTILWYELSDQYYTNMIKRIDSIRAEDLLPIAEKYFNEDDYFELAVG